MEKYKQSKTEGSGVEEASDVTNKFLEHAFDVDDDSVPRNRAQQRDKQE